MNYIDETFRLQVKSDIINGKSINGNPLDINNGHMIKNFLKKQKYYSQLLDILDKHPNFQTLTFLVRCIYFNSDLLKCKVCGKELTYSQSFKSKSAFGHHCSRKCAANDPILKEYMLNALSNYYMENFGVTNCMQLSATVQRAKKTFIQHYGVDNNMKSERGMLEYKQSMNEKYGVDYTWELSSVQEKRKQSCLSSLGVEFPFQSPEIIQQTVETKYEKNNGKYFSEHSISSRISSYMERYGTDHNMKSETGLQEFYDAMIEKYGVKHPVEIPGVHEKIINTTFKNYGVYYPAQSHEIFMRIRGSYVYEELKFDSKPELAFYIWLNDNNIEFEYQPDDYFIYELDGISHKYFPDFKINNIFYEIKGDQFVKADGTWQCPYNHLLDTLFEAKRQCCLTNNVIILYKKQYKKYLTYISKTYGASYLNQFKTK